MEIGTSAVGQEVVNITTIETSFPAVSPTTMQPTTKRPLLGTTPLAIASIDDHQTMISQAGAHVYLPCNVKQIVQSPISWLRVRDGHILTVDQTTFIADQRFQPIYAPNSERWSLQIKFVQLKDAGAYECQVSTEPKSSALVTLRVVEPKTELIGKPTQHVKAGSQVKLRCIISQTLDPPVFINWFHNQKQIYLHSRRGWRTEIERTELPIPDFSTTTETTTSAISTPAITKSATTEQSESATAINPSAEGVIESTTTVVLLLANMDSTDFGNARKSTPLVQATTRDGESPTATPSTNLPFSRLDIDFMADIVGSGNSFEFDTDNATFSLLPTTSTIVSTKVKKTYSQKSILTITTTSSPLEVMEVRQVTTATLIIPSVEKKDSGNFTCSPSNSAPKTAVLHVLDGEYSASAITAGASGKINVVTQCKWRGTILYLIFSHWHHEFASLFTQLQVL